MIAITLPWPPRTLHPNERPHWAKKAAATKQARASAGWAAKLAGIRLGDPDIPTALKVTAVFNPPDRRPRDMDGLISNIKAYCDGIADVIGIDDSKWEWQAPRREAPVNGGSVRIELEAACGQPGDN